MNTNKSAAPRATSTKKQVTAMDCRKLLDLFVDEGALAAGVVVTYPNGDQLILQSGFEAPQSLISGKVKQ